MVVRSAFRNVKMIRVDDKIYFDHIDQMLLDQIATHPDIRQADLMHQCPLSRGGAYQRLMRLGEAGFIKVSYHGLRSTTYRMAPATKNLKNESAATTAPKQGENHARIIP